MGNDECQSVFKTEVSKAEWDQVNRLRSAVGDDERHFTGRIHLSCDGTRRIWEASNSFRALRYVGGDDTGVIASRSMSHDNLKAALEGIEMLIAFGSDAAGLEAPFHVTVVMPETEDAPVQFFGRDSAAVVKPRPSRARLAQDHVEAVIRECFDTVAAERDADGDYPLFRHRVPVFGRLDLSSDPLWLQVYTVLLSNIERTPELLEELNDLNQHMSFAPLYHQVTEDGVGQVVSEIDLLAETLDPAELHTAVQRIHELAINITPTLAAVFGGDVAADPAEVRWLSYGDTVVEAELVPETLTALTGAEGIEPWPFPGPVYVITGWNPQGVSLGEARHRGVNQRIADEVRLISCHDGRVEARPRRGT